MNKTKLIMFAIAICCLILTLQMTIHAGTTAYNWYCKRNTNHCQPKCEPGMDFISQYNCFFIDTKLNDNSTPKRVYLTFDAGYENGNVEKILDILKEKNVPAAFFILNNIIKTNTDLIKRMAQEGHTVCNHTASHKDMSKIYDINEFSQELQKLENTYKEYTGLDMAKYYRPPEGRFSEENLEFASQLGYKTIFWSFAYADWDNKAQPSPDKALKLILDNVHNGAVLLLHPTSATNVSILGELIDILKNEGYTFGTLDQLTV